VQVISGRYKATQGKVLVIDRLNNQVVVQGANLKFKVVEDEEMQRRKKTIRKEFPIHISNVQLVDPSNNEATKIKYGYLEDGSKVRISKKSGAIIPKPDRSHLTYINRTKSREIGINDTRGDLVLEKTY
jgi:large subunit ribosomal protein L24